MFVLMSSKSSSKLGRLVSKTRSPGQISRKLCYNHFELWSECLPWSVLDQALKVLCCSGECYRAIMALLFFFFSFLSFYFFFLIIIFFFFCNVYFFFIYLFYFFLFLSFFFLLSLKIYLYKKNNIIRYYSQMCWGLSVDHCLTWKRENIFVT